MTADAGESVEGPCLDCRSGADLMPEERCDSCGRVAPDIDLSDCPYYGRFIGAPGHDPNGTCSHGCWEEPECVTGEPRDGWPGTAVLLGSNAEPAQ